MKLRTLDVDWITTPAVEPLCFAKTVADACYCGYSATACMSPCRDTAKGNGRDGSWDQAMLISITVTRLSDTRSVHL